MPAGSIAQRRMAGADLARKRRGQKTRTGMTTGQLRDYAGTKEKGLSRALKKRRGNPHY